MTGSIIAIYYGKFCKLLKSLIDKFILNNIKIIKDLNNIKNKKNIRDMEKVRHTKNMRKARYVEHIEDVEGIKDNEVARCNNRLSDSKDQNN